MLRMLTAAALCLAAVPLAECGGAKFDRCGGAQTRRAAYVIAITAADAHALSSRPMPQAVVLGRQAAVAAIAIAILDARCPRLAD